MGIISRLFGRKRREQAKATRVYGHPQAPPMQTKDDSTITNLLLIQAITSDPKHADCPPTAHQSPHDHQPSYGSSHNHDSGYSSSHSSHDSGSHGGFDGGSSGGDGGGGGGGGGGGC